MIKLTRRQQEFLSSFLDLFSERHDALHYTVVARHLGVGNVSAYEMLRLLERRGLVEAIYRLPAKPRGPGRATVLFRPTPLATQLFTQLVRDDLYPEEWEAAKRRILRQIEAGKLEGYEPLLDELLARAPNQRSPLIYGAEMIATLILALDSLGERSGAKGVARHLQSLLALGDAALNALVGLSLGLSAVESVNRRVADFMLTQAERFQVVIAGLSKKSRRRLAEFTQEAMQALER